MKSRLKIGALLILSSLVVWLVIVAISIWRFGFTDHSRESDCAIVLGAAISGRGPSPVFEERIKHGLTLYKEGTVSKLVFTGGTGEGTEYSEAEVGASYAIANGIPALDVLKEEVSRTTRENLVEAKQQMDASGLRTAVIVSDPLHLKRAQMMATDLGLDAVASPTPTSRYRSFRTRMAFLLRELYFVHHYRLFGH